MKLYLVRHPQPDIEPGYCYGATDVPVTQAALARVHDSLRAAGLPGRLPVYSSPLQRCALLAFCVAPRSLRFDARLAEMDFGTWEMRAWSDIPRTEIDAWAADLLAYRPGGAENLLEVAHRLVAFVEELQQELRSSAASEALLVCHAGTMRLLCAMRGGVPLEQAALRAAARPHRIGYGEVMLLEY